MSQRPDERGQRPAVAPGRDDDTAVRPGLTGVQERDRDSSRHASGRERWSGGEQATSHAPRGSSAASPSRSRAQRAAPTAVRRARLRLTRVDPWSVMKTAFLLSIALGVVIIVSVFMVWSVLSAAGVWESINSTVQSIVGGQDATNFDVEDYLGTSRIMGFTMLVAVVDVFAVTAMATLGAFLYNMSAQLLGGVEVTLSEDR